MTTGAALANRADDSRAPAISILEDALARAAHRDGMTFVVVDAPLGHPACLVDAWASDVVASWSSDRLELVGIGIARELRGRGDARWTQLAGEAASLTETCTIVDGRATTRGTILFAASDDAFVRPRWFGGAAFAPGAAERAPWAGFGDAWFVLPRWTYIREGERAALLLAVDATSATETARWQAELARHLAALAAPFVPRGQPAVVELAHAHADSWREQVTSITDAIARGACSKIVAARTANVVLAGAVRPAELLAALDERHADCVRVMIHPPGAGMLVAATPERLVRRDGALVECDALAGTRNASDAEAAARLLESGKDRNEHQLVVDAIGTALHDAGGTVDAPAEPTVKRLRHVLHLHTPFRATFARPPHLLELAARLHPTPAVGGTPTALAVEWIRDREPVPRGWYASPVGWFDLDGNGELVVAIRSGVLAGNRAWLWAGAGIVAGSDPDRELAETESKLRAMLGALGATT